MTKILQGVIRGRTVELLGDPGIAEGRSVEVTLRVKQLPPPPPGWHPGSQETAAGMLADLWTAEDDRELAEIQRARHESTRDERRP